MGPNVGRTRAQEALGLLRAQADGWKMTDLSALAREWLLAERPSICDIELRVPRLAALLQRVADEAQDPALCGPWPRLLAAEAQVAALREQVDHLLRLSLPTDISAMTWIAAARDALADTAAAAQAHDERVRAEEREACAKVAEMWKAVAPDPTQSFYTYTEQVAFEHGGEATSRLLAGRLAMSQVPSGRPQADRVSDERLAELAKAAPAGPWRWEQSYGMGDGSLHWCLVNDEAGKTISVSMVTMHDQPDWFGVPCDQMPAQAFIAAFNPSTALDLLSRLRDCRAERDAVVMQNVKIDGEREMAVAERDALKAGYALLERITGIEADRDRLRALLVAHGIEIPNARAVNGDSWAALKTEAGANLPEGQESTQTETVLGTERADSCDSRTPAPDLQREKGLPREILEGPDGGWYDVADLQRLAEIAVIEAREDAARFAATGVMCSYPYIAEAAVERWRKERTTKEES